MSPSTSAMDYSLPISTLLRIGTSKAHEDAEHSPGAALLVTGQLDKEEYVRYLMMLWHVYDIFERALDQHATLPALQPTYNPPTLARRDSLTSDIAYLLQVPESSWQNHHIHKALMTSPPQVLTDYTKRLRELADASDPSPLLAHAYVRYLGDLSGGQFIRRNIAKAYNLDKNGLGLQFYDFKELGGSKSGNIGDFKKIKEWYREGMNAGVGDDLVMKEAIVQEANIAFALNTGLFNDLKPPTPKSEIPPPNQMSESIPSILGDVSSASEDDEPPSLVEKVPFTERSYSLATVSSFIAAVCLAHFLLVTGGFTGSRGVEKLESVEGWVRAIWATFMD